MATGTAIDIRFDARQLQDYVLGLLALGHSPERMLNQIGTYYKGETKRKFSDAPWPAKPEHWAYWQGGKAKPLTGKSGALARSIEHDVSGTTLRVGSVSKYAPTHQHGDDEQRSFYVYLYPELKLKNGRYVVAHFEGEDGKPGYPKGKLAPKHEFTGDSPLSRKAAGIGAKRSGLKGKGKADSYIEQLENDGSGLRRGVIRILMKQRIKARPFLAEPTPTQWSQIAAICERHLLMAGNSRARGAAA